MLWHHADYKNQGGKDILDILVPMFWEAWTAWYCPSHGPVQMYIHVQGSYSSCLWHGCLAEGLHLKKKTDNCPVSIKLKYPRIWCKISDIEKCHTEGFDWQNFIRTDKKLIFLLHILLFGLTRFSKSVQMTGMSKKISIKTTTTTKSS